MQHAAEHGVPAHDLLPILAHSLAAENLDPGAYFIDADHPTPAGSRVIAESLVRFVTRESLAARSPDAGEPLGDRAP